MTVRGSKGPIVFDSVFAGVKKCKKRQTKIVSRYKKAKAEIDIPPIVGLSAYTLYK